MAHGKANSKTSLTDASGISPASQSSATGAVIGTRNIELEKKLDEMIILLSQINESLQRLR